MKADLVARPRGPEMFGIARDALVRMSSRVPGFAGAVARPDKFCHGFGIFQVDLQFFLTDPAFFLERQWRSFDVCLRRCVGELTRAKRAAGLGDRTTLTDLERVHVAIAYNTGSFKPEKGLQQGFFDGQKFYGEQIFDFLRVAQTVSVPNLPSPIAAPPPGTAIVTPPTPVTSTGRLLEVDAKDSPLRLRSEPRIDKANPTSNVIARLPDGHLVRRVSGAASDTFLEVETSLNTILEAFALAARRLACNWRNSAISRSTRCSLSRPSVTNTSASGRLRSAWIIRRRISSLRVIRHISIARSPNRTSGDLRWACSTLKMSRGEMIPSSRQAARSEAA